MNYKIAIFMLTYMMLFGACKDDVLPKPKAMLRLDYPEMEYGKLSTRNFEFSKNEMAKVNIENKQSLTLDYPLMKGSIFINYKKVDGDLEKLLADAQKLSYEHTIKADGIKQKEYINDTRKVYGMFYEVSGDAASQAQFYATDSTEHFVMGSLYFYAKPNYDSIYPAAVYLQKDMGRIMESLKWKD